MNARAKVTALLEECGAVLKRSRKHQVYELPNGKNFVRASTPSDSKSDLNNLSDLNHQLEIVVPKKIGAAPSRAKTLRAKPKKQVSTERMKSKVASLSLAESLRMAGLTDDALRDQVAAIGSRVAEIEERQQRIEEHQSRCPACRFMNWWNRNEQGQTGAN